MAVCTTEITPTDMRAPAGGARRAHPRLALGFGPPPWLCPLLACSVAWLAFRIVFFVGLVGSDDLYLLRYAALWDRAPANGWEARLVGNLLTWVCLKAFGFSETAAVLPSILASFALLATVVAYCVRQVGERAGYWAGLAVAALPLDVEMATQVSPHTLMSAWMAVGTVALIAGAGSRRWRYVSAICLPLGVVTHLAGVYYVAALLAAALVLDRHRYGRAAVTVVLGGVLFVLADMVLFQLMFGDPLLRFRLCAGAAAEGRSITPLTPDGSLNLTFLWWPIIHLWFSKPFGLLLLVVLGLGSWNWRSLDTGMRVLLLTTTLTWLWISYGSIVPWDYRPFERMMRYLQPASFAIVVLFATLVAGTRHARFGFAVGGPALAVCVVNLLAGGSWDQSVPTSRELLRYAQRHPDVPYVTDHRTLNEMFVIAGMRATANVSTTADVEPWKLFDRAASPEKAGNTPPCDAVLVNPLNSARSNAFQEFVATHAGPVQFETAPVYRTLCRILPPLKRYSWAVKRPPARVLACQAGAPQQMD